MLMKEFVWPEKSELTMTSDAEHFKSLLQGLSEEDHTVDTRSITINNDLTVNVDGSILQAQKNFFDNLSEMLKYPKRNFSTDLETQRVAGDINQLLDLRDDDDYMTVRLHKGVLYSAFYRYGKKMHIPPYLHESFDLLSDYHGDLARKYKEVHNTYSLLNGDITTTSLLTRDNIAFEDDPSYAGIFFAIRNSTWPGINSGFNLKRTMCDNSSIFPVERSWKGAMGTRDTSLESYQRSLRLAERYLPALTRIYHEMITDSVVETEYSFNSWKDFVRTYMGRKTDTVLHKWLDEDVNGVKFFSQPQCVVNNRHSVYDVFNDVTYYAREMIEDEKYLEKAQLCAGAIFAKYMKQYIKDIDVEIDLA